MLPLMQPDIVSGLNSLARLSLGSCGAYIAADAITSDDVLKPTEILKMGLGASLFGYAYFGNFTVGEFLQRVVVNNTPTGDAGTFLRNGADIISNIAVYPNVLPLISLGCAIQSTSNAAISLITDVRQSHMVSDTFAIILYQDPEAWRQHFFENSYVCADAAMLAGAMAMTANAFATMFFPGSGVAAQWVYNAGWAACATGTISKVILSVSQGYGKAREAFIPPVPAPQPELSIWRRLCPW
jgi:hypothetical protein